MQFRWVVGITFWTFLAGPIIGPPTAAPHPASSQATVRPAIPQTSNPPAKPAAPLAR